MRQKIGNTPNIPSRELLILCGILLLGFLLRVFYLSEIRDNPDFSKPILDASFHHYWAKGLATGNWSVPESHNDPLIQSIPYIKFPGYPYFLAFIYWLFGPGFLVSRVIQMSLGIVNCILAFLLGRKWFGSTVGLIFSSFISIYWIFIYFEGELYAPVLSVFFALLLIYILSTWVIKISFLRCAISGLLLGTFALVRANILLFIPVAIMWLTWILYRRKDWHNFPLSIAGFTLGIALAISPATIRNYMVANEFVLISTIGGLNLYIGNKGSPYDYSTIPNLKEMAGIDAWTLFDYPKIVRGLGRKLGKHLTFTEASSYWANEALHYIKAHPRESLIHTFRKALRFWYPKEIANPIEIHYARAQSRTLRNIPGNFSAVLSLSIAGIILMFLNFKKEGINEKAPLTFLQIQYEVVILILLFIVTYFVTFLPFHVSARYRLPIIPFLLLFGSYGLYRVSKFIRSRDFRNATGWLCFIIITYASLQSNFVNFKPDRARWHYYNGVSFLQNEETDRAIKEYLEAIKIKPDFLEAHNHLGAALFKKGNYNEAIDHYLKALQINPNNADTLNNVGITLGVQKKYDEAISYYRKALLVRPDYAVVYYNLGLVLTAQGKTNDAITHLTRALLIKPDYMEAHHDLGLLLAKQGNLDEAITHFSEALRIKPDYAPALQNLEFARNLLKRSK
tara:strand:- start:15070 stop:17109 length:2040 start_codon:yes stop_codon:yes gene_type:complete